MGSDLLERFRQAGFEAAGKRRNVTVLFVDLSDYTKLAQQVNDEDLYELVQQYINLLANDVYKYEGMVDKFTGDGLMALFGAPIAHENNAELAVRSALDMVEDVGELSRKSKELLTSDLRVHIGIHSGPVIIGGIGSNNMMNYTAIGDMVNLAQRLENAASPGIILVSEAVYRQTRRLFDFHPTPTLQLKGVRQPVKSYQVANEKVKPGIVRGIEGLRAPMIGRDLELTRLQEAIDALKELRKGSFILITGEAGIGKSRLTAEFKALVGPSPVTIVEGQSLAYRRMVAYWIFLSAIQSLLGILLDTPPIRIRLRLREAVTQAMEARAAEVLPYLEHLLSLTPSDRAAAERIQYLDAVQLRQQIFLAVRDFLVAEAHLQPLLLILEDLHWADQASLDLLSFLLDSVKQAPLLIVAISRPIQEGTLSKITDWVAQNLPDSYCQLHLHSLSHDQSERLLFQLLETTMIPDALCDQILQRAAGVPFYMEEILRMLIDQGILQREGSHWKLASEVDINALGVPETLEGLILARFDRLSEDQRRVLQVASVIGLQFSLPVLQMALQPMDKDSLMAALAHLSEREFVNPMPDSPYTEYTFRHTLMSDAIYKTMLKKERSELHGRVGEAIETIYAQQLEGQVEILARHFSWSPMYDQALHYLILAGQKAMRAYANEQARQHFEQAMELLSKVPYQPYQALQVRAGLGDVLAFTGEYNLARDQYQAALQLISEPESGLFTGERGTLLRKIGTTYERQGDYDLALLCLDQANQVLDETHTPDPIERAQILNDIGWIHFRRGNIEEASQMLSNALSMAEESSRYDVIASIYNRLGGVYFQKDQVEQASSFVQKSLALREEIGDIVAVARSYNNLGLLSWKRGNLDGALQSFLRSLELHANLGDIEGLIELHGNLGLVQLDRGDIDSSQKHLEESLAKAQHIGHTYNTATACLYLSRLFVSIEEWQKALDFGSRGIKIYQDIGVLDYIADAYSIIGQAWLGLENLEMAEYWANKAIDFLEHSADQKEARTADDRGRALRLLGEIHRLHGDYLKAEQMLKESLSIFELLGAQIEQARSLAALARLAASRKDAAGSRVLLNEARLILRQLGANHDLRKIQTQ